MKASTIKTVGILTSGGDAPGLNAAIRALCISGKNNYGMKFIGIRNGYRGLIDNDTFKMDELDLEPLISQGGTILGTSRVKPFKNPVPDPKTGLLPVDGIKETFKKTNPDLASDIIQNGILLTGGGGLLSGLDRYLTQQLEIPVWVSETALTNVVTGCLKVLETPTALKQTLMRSR